VCVYDPLERGDGGNQCVCMIHWREGMEETSVCVYDPGERGLEGLDPFGCLVIGW